MLMQVHCVHNVNHYHMHHHVYAWVYIMDITLTHPCVLPYPYGVPTHTHGYIHVCMSTVYTQRGVPTHHVYSHVHTTVYIPMCICRYLYYPPMHRSRAHGRLRGVPCEARCGGPRLLLHRVASLHPSTPPVLRRCATRSVLRPWACATAPSVSPCGRGYFTDPIHLTRPRARDHDGSRAPLRRGHEEVADQYLRALLRFFMVDLYPRDAFELVRGFVTEATNDIRDFEGEEVASRIDAALRRLIDRAEADEAFMAELTERAERVC